MFTLSFVFHVLPEKLFHKTVSSLRIDTSLVIRISWIQNTKQVLIGIKNTECYLPLLIPTTASHVVDILKGMSIKKRKLHLKGNFI